ncbi:MAG: hypothetical protein ACXW3C_01375 [Pyrinomonadaceae bacterium]
MAIPVGSQTRPRRVTEAAENSTTPARSDERPRVARERATSALEQPRREGGGSRWLRGLLGMGIEIGARRAGGSSCSPSRHVFLGMPRSRY